MNVQVITFEPQEMPNIVDVSIDSVGRNYAVFWSKSKKDMNYSCSYYKVVFKNKIIVNKLSHTLLQCGFREIEWSRIENLFFFKTRGQIQVGHFDDVNAATPSKFTGVLNTIDISPNSEISYDSSGRYIGVYEPNILKYCVYNAFGLLRFVKQIKGGQSVIWRPVPEIDIDAKLEKEIVGYEEKNNMKTLLDKYREEDLERRKKYQLQQDNKAQLKEANVSLIGQIQPDILSSSRDCPKEKKPGKIPRLRELSFMVETTM